MRSQRILVFAVLIILVLVTSAWRVAARGEEIPAQVTQLTGWAGVGSASGLEMTVAATGSQNLELIGQLGGPTYAVAVQGDYAYLGIGPRLVVLDVSDRTQPTLIGQSGLLTDFVQDIVLEETYAYIAAGGAGFRVFNISDKAAPRETGSFETQGFAYGVVVEGGIAYVADDDGLRIIDVSDGANLVELGSFNALDSIKDVAIHEGHALMVGGAGFLIIDISNPSDPIEVGSLEITGTTLALAGNYAFVTRGETLLVIDVSNPSTPVQIGSYEVPPRSSRFPIDHDFFDVEVVGDKAFVGATWGLLILDVSSLTTPKMIHYEMLDGSIIRLAIAKESNTPEEPIFVYAANNRFGLSIFDVSDPLLPVEVGGFESIGDALDVVLDGNQAYVVDRYRDLRVLDITHPANLQEVGGHNLRSDIISSALGSTGVAILGRTAYLSYQSPHISDLYIFDISDPANPRVLSGNNSNNGAESVAVGRNPSVGSNKIYAYLAGGFQIYDVTNPVSPIYLSYLSVGGTDIEVIRNYAFLAGPDGLVIVNVKDPINPFVISSYPMSDFAKDLAVNGDYIYITDWGYGLRIIDISDVTMPVEVGSYETPEYAQAVGVSGRYAYVLGRNILYLLDVSDPKAPTELGYIELPGYGQDVAAKGNLAYVASGSGGLYVIGYHPYQLYLPISYWGGAKPVPAPTSTTTPTPSPTVQLTGFATIPVIPTKTPSLPAHQPQGTPGPPHGRPY